MNHLDRPHQSEFTWAAATLLIATLAITSIFLFSTSSSLYKILLEAVRYGWVGGLLLLVALLYVLVQRRLAVTADPLACKIVVGLLGYFLFMIAVAISVLHFYETTALIPVSLATMAGACFLLGGYLSAPRQLLKMLSCMCLFLAVLSGFGNWLPQVEGGFPPQEYMFPRDMDSMTPQQLADEGEKIIFGGIGLSKVQGAVGKGQCPLCHVFERGIPRGLAPNLWGITARKRLKAAPIDYIAESHICPNCYVLGGFAVKGTDGKDSYMPRIHKPPISLTLDELIAIDTWLFVREGLVPPSPHEIEAAYRKVTPDTEWPALTRSKQPSMEIEALRSKFILTGDEPAEVMLARAGCVYCHVIQGVPHPTTWIAGTRDNAPKLVLKTMATKRIDDARYQGNATSVREYIMESILDPESYVVSGYTSGMMPSDYGEVLNAKTLDVMTEYLVELEEENDVGTQQAKEDSF